MIEEVKKGSPPPKKRHPILRIVTFFVTLALVLGAICLVVNRDRLNFDALKRWFTYRTLAQSDTGGGEPFPYQSGGQMTFTTCGGDLLAVSQTGVRLYSPSGTAYIEETVSLEHPVCQASGKTAVVYDAGGTFLKVYKDRGAQFFALPDNTSAILSARLNGDGYLSVVSRSSGYKGVVTVYDSSFRKLLELRLSSAFILDSLVSPDNKSVLVVTASQENRLFSCSLAQYSLDHIDQEHPTPTASLPLGNRLPLDLTWNKDGLRVLTEYAAISADSSLAQTGLFEWSDRYLKRYSLQADSAFVTLTGKYQAGSQTTLEVTDLQGQSLGTMEETHPILALSAAGKYVAILTAQRLEVYTKDMTLYGQVENTQGASYVALLPDGSAYLATQDTAWLALPNS